MNPDLRGATTERLGVFTTAQALDGGHTADEIKRFVDTGRWRRLRRGAFVEGARWDAASDLDRHALAHAAVQCVTTWPVAASALSAAWLHHLPLIVSPPRVPEVVAERRHYRAIPGARMFNGALLNQTVEHDGLLLTSVARTISDVARVRGVLEAVVMLEHALREGLTSDNAYRRVLAACPTWKGIAHAKRALELAEPLNESPGESLSLLRMREQSIPLPRCQVTLDVGGRRIRPDFWWPERGVLGEFDGRMKYATAGDVYAEKRREDDLRGQGFVVARWGWEHVRDDGAGMAAIIRRAFAAAGATPPP